MKFSGKTIFRIVLSTIILLAVIATTILIDWPSTFSTGQSTGPVDECGPIEPAEKDVKKVLSLGGDIFTSPNWEKSYTVEPYRIALTRRNNVEAVIVFTEYLIFTCGYGQAELNDYFSDENFAIFFADYQSHVITDFCEKENDLALYHLDLLLDGEEYLGRIWVKQEDDTHLLTTRLILPKTSLALLEQYSRKLFPEMTSCQ